ncbi:MAG: hypothetical protein IT343_01675 [Candidatus Melainabacteria bacterium]|nr:hypothetical protein [Candidatus Melainabacteria bacterium]
MADYLNHEKLLRKELLEHIDITKTIKISDLRRPDLAFDYTDALPLFEMIRNQIIDAASLNLSAVPEEVLSSAKKAVEETNRLFSVILEMSPPSSETKTKQNISHVLAQWRGELANAITDLYKFSLTDSTIRDAAVEIKTLAEGLEKAIANATTAADTARASAKDADAVTEQLVKTMQNYIDRVKGTLESLGAAEYMKRFEIEAQEHKDSAQNWLMAVFAFGWWILVAAIYFLWTDSHSVPALLKHGIPGAITSTSARLFLMSVLSVGLFLSVKNYSACKHNYVVNKHRINALGTFKFFRDGAQDDETKKAVLIQSMQAIFAPQSTGYLKTANEPQQNTHIIELIQSTLKSSPHQ